MLRLDLASTSVLFPPVWSCIDLESHRLCDLPRSIFLHCIDQASLRAPPDCKRGINPHLSSRGFNPHLSSRKKEAAPLLSRTLGDSDGGEGGGRGDGGHGIGGNQEASDFHERCSSSTNRPEIRAELPSAAFLGQIRAEQSSPWIQKGRGTRPGGGEETTEARR